MGRATASLFSKEGAIVIINDISEKDLEETLNILTGGDNMSFVGDISKSDEVKRMFKQIESKYKKLDIVVNNAGIGRFQGDGENGEIHEMEDGGWRGVMGVNLDGTFHVSREAVRLMLKTKTKGSLINISPLLIQTFTPQIP